jgi:hypothetical protein
LQNTQQLVFDAQSLSVVHLQVKATRPLISAIKETTNEFRSTAATWIVFSRPVLKVVRAASASASASQQRKHH